MAGILEDRSLCDVAGSLRAGTGDEAETLLNSPCLSHHCGLLLLSCCVCGMDLTLRLHHRTAVARVDEGDVSSELPLAGLSAAPGAEGDGRLVTASTEH